MQVLLDHDDGARLWVPVGTTLDSVAERIVADWGPGLRGEQDKDWMPAQIAREHPAGPDFTHLVLEADGRIQGYAVVQHRRDWRSGGLYETGAYLAYAAAAPWNRKVDDVRIDERFARLKPIGPLLLGLAVQVSRTRGQNGRLSLHSLSRAEPWYIEQLPGIHDFGVDLEGVDKGLRFLEAEPAVTAAFVERNGLMARIRV